MTQWFTYQNERVQGPFSTDHVKAMVTSGTITANHRIWGPAIENWLTSKKWVEVLPTLELNRARALEAQEWHFALNGESFGPFSRADMISQLKENRKNYEVLIWTKGMKAWTPIFEFYDLMDALGINRRQYPRMEVDGRVVIKWEETTAIGVLTIVGEGGFGARNLQNNELRPGMYVSAEVQSKNFRESLHVKAEVRGVDPDGSVGFRFVQISIESKSAIIEYVRHAQAARAA